MASFLYFISLFPFVVFAAYEDAYKVAYDTVLQKKCESLKLRYDAAYIGDRCFAISKESFSTTIDKWFDTLSSKCTHLYGYHAKIGNIYNEKQIDEFLDHDLLENNKKYFIGARQNPNDKELGKTCCNPKGHRERWYYVGDDGKMTTNEINSKLWIKGQPDDAGMGNGEYVLALERLVDTTNKLGFNDINPEDDKYQVLCEYVDFQTCPANWTLIGSMCYRVFTDLRDVDSAKAQCVQEGGTKGRLAAIHNDRLNQLLADIARENFNYASVDPNTRDLTHNPVLFGLSYNGGTWSYDSGDLVDYFRWYDKAGSTLPRNRSPVLLNTLNSGAQGEARYTYWTVGNADGRYPYVCQTEPTIV